LFLFSISAVTFTEVNQAVVKYNIKAISPPYITYVMIFYCSMGTCWYHMTSTTIINLMRNISIQISRLSTLFEFPVRQDVTLISLIFDSISFRIGLRKGTILVLF